MNKTNIESEGSCAITVKEGANLMYKAYLYNRDSCKDWRGQNIIPVAVRFSYET